MKALTLLTADGPASAQLTDHPDPKPAKGEVRVAVKAASLNHRELWISRGQYPKLTLPCTMGADGAGIVDDVGEGVNADLLGREVVIYPGLDWGADRRFPSKSFGLLGMPGPGTVAEYICVPAENVFPKPATLSFEEAAALPTTALTAWRGLIGKAALQSGESVLITGAGGGVATIAILLARALGAHVYVTSGSDDTIARACAHGAKAGFNYRSDTWRKELADASGGIDVVFDGAPVAGYAGYMRAVKLGGRVVVYGSTGGAQFQVNAPELFLKHATLYGTAMGDLTDFAAMLDFVAANGLKPVIDKSFSLQETTEAMIYLDEGRQFGKVVVSI
ncbi:alcohol dehydrogenase [alpha proteobacterium U9-1i]|nr:alcohol dehydrogenase [alpha proteobacterium U9-1i]